MKQSIATLLLTGSLLFLAYTTQAQVTVNFAPRLGLNLSSASFKDEYRSYNTTTRAGLEVGGMLYIHLGHLSLQPALLYSQKGFNIVDSYTVTDNYYYNGSKTTTTLNEKYRLNYLTLPINLAYSQHKDGQGLQVFAGPYVSSLLGGTYSYDDSDFTPAIGPGGVSHLSTQQESGDVGTGDYYTTNRTDTKFYSRSVDFGLQVGAGYRYQNFLLHASYSQGLRNVGADFKVVYGGSSTRIFPGPAYYNHAIQLSFAYLLGSKD